MPDGASLPPRSVRRGPGRSVAKVVRKPRGRGYSYDALLVLRQVWAASGGQCGKYLAASMKIQLDLLEAHGEVVRDDHAGDACEERRESDMGRYSDKIRAELLTMSGAHHRPVPEAVEGS
jgi:hypothetical protein